MLLRLRSHRKMGEKGQGMGKHAKHSLTTLCYLERGGQYLMLHRVKKEHDLNRDKYVGIGGHFEEGESPGECLLREVKEETGLVLTSYRPRGFITFVSDVWGTEYMHLYTADGFAGEIGDCAEGELCWVDKEKVCDLPIWAGDTLFFRLLAAEEPYFFLKLVYHGDALTSAHLNDRPVDLAGFGGTSHGKTV